MDRPARRLLLFLALALAGTATGCAWLAGESDHALNPFQPRGVPTGRMVGTAPGASLALP